MAGDRVCGIWQSLATSPLQIIFRVAHWTHFRSPMLKEEEQYHIIKWMCEMLEATMMHNFSSHGWRFSNRLCFLSSLAWTRCLMLWVSTLFYFPLSEIILCVYIKKRCGSLSTLFGLYASSVMDTHFLLTCEEHITIVALSCMLIITMIDLVYLRCKTDW